MDIGLCGFFVLQFTFSASLSLSRIQIAVFFRRVVLRINDPSSSCFNIFSLLWSSAAVTMTSQAVRPQPVLGLPAVVDQETSCRVAQKVLGWTISQILRDRLIFPADAFNAKSHDGEEVITLSRQVPVRGKELRDYQLAVNNLLDILKLIFDGVHSQMVRGIVMQLHDGQDYEKIFEEWRFDVEYTNKEATGFSITARGRDDQRLNLNMDRDAGGGANIVLGQIMHSLGKIREAVKVVKPIDFDNLDVRLAFCVFYSAEAVENGQIPGGFEVKDTLKTGKVENPARYKLGKTDIGHHCVEIKVKTSLHCPSSSRRNLQSSEEIARDSEPKPRSKRTATVDLSPQRTAEVQEQEKPAGAERRGRKRK